MNTKLIFHSKNRIKFYELFIRFWSYLEFLEDVLHDPHLRLWKFQDKMRMKNEDMKKDPANKNPPVPKNHTKFLKITQYAYHFSFDPGRNCFICFS